MSRSVDLTAVSTYFYERVSSELQNMQYLQGTCTEMDTQGQTVSIPVFGPVEMVERDFGAGGIPIQQTRQRAPVITLKDYAVKTTIGKAYQTLFDVDVLEAAIMQHTTSIGRKLDELKIDAVVANSYTEGTNQKNVDPSSGSGAASLTVSDFTAALLGLLNNGVHQNMISYWINYPDLANMLSQEDQFSSWDFNSTRPLMRSPLAGYTYQGVPFCPVAGAAEINGAGASNKIPNYTATNTYRATYFVDAMSVKIAFNRRPQTRVVNVEDHDQTVVLSVVTAQAAVINPNGVYRLGLRNATS